MSRLFRRDRIWPTAIALVLLGNVALGITLMRVASADPHFAVEPDYYRRAIGWDTTQARANQSAALGWQVHPTLAALSRDSTPFAVLLTERDGTPLDSARIEVVARPIAHANLAVSRVLAPRGAGRYDTAMAIDQAGLWEFLVTVDYAGERLVAPLRIDARSDAAGTLVLDRPGQPDPARVAAGLRRE
ncbi:MAG: FixH family protein [Gemmatimonadales bacterium]